MNKVPKTTDNIAKILENMEHSLIKIKECDDIINKLKIHKNFCLLCYLRMKNII